MKDDLPLLILFFSLLFCVVMVVLFDWLAYSRGECDCFNPSSSICLIVWVVCWLVFYFILYRRLK